MILRLDYRTLLLGRCFGLLRILGYVEIVIMLFLIFGIRKVLTDVQRLHQFEDGKCSCGDFWLTLSTQRTIFLLIQAILSPGEYLICHIVNTRYNTCYLKHVL